MEYLVNDCSNEKLKKKDINEEKELSQMVWL